MARKNALNKLAVQLAYDPENGGRLSGETKRKKK
jgi:hypothetical protein